MVQKHSFIVIYFCLDLSLLKCIRCWQGCRIVWKLSVYMWKVCFLEKFKCLGAETRPIEYSQDHFPSQGPVDLWRQAFWVPVGVGRSKCEQHLYRCCVIFIALLHLLGGISFSVNNQVNCTQTRSGTPANFFYCYANSSNFFSSSQPPITKSFPFTPSILSHESSFTPKLFLPP